MCVDANEVMALAAEGETLTVEFKEGRRAKLNDATITDAVVCLANARGGLLLLGVTDGGEVQGLEPRHGAITEPHRIDAMILANTSPPLGTTTELVQVGDVEVAVVSVPQVSSPVGTAGGKYLRRAIDATGRPGCRPYPLHEMLSAGLSAQGVDFAAIPARGAGFAELSTVEFERFRKLCGRTGGDAVLKEATDVEILGALRLVRPEDPQVLTMGAILLFGSEEALRRYLPNHEIVFQDLVDDRILFAETSCAPLLAAAEHLEELISARNTEQEFLSGLIRVGIRRIPPEVVRECIANALVHRDYTALGPVRVQLDENEFRVTSPGGFPNGITFENLLDASVPRSPILAEAFKRAGIVDRAGRGIREMYDHLLRSGRGVPDYRRSTAQFVEVVVPTADADLEFVRFVLEFETGYAQSLRLGELRVLHELRQGGPQSIAELGETLELGAPSLRPILHRLRELGLVDVRGAGRNRRYSLTADFYRIAQASEYVRMQDTDPIQQARMVTEYVRSFGRITRGKAAELCRITPQQATALLQGMVRDGVLEMHGERRGARYELVKD